MFAARFAREKAPVQNPRNEAVFPNPGRFVFGGCN
jgi:hypothetical protein